MSTGREQTSTASNEHDSIARSDFEPTELSQQDDAALQPDEAETQDVDSALGDDQSSLTQSLKSSLRESVQENGRGYHRYKSTAGLDYIVPEDELEQDRLDLQHEMYLFTFNGKLFNAPLDPSKIQNVLDVGTGTGIWAIDFADEHPNAQVIGMDLSPIQPQYTPPNCKFEVDDLNSEWTYTQKFDFIHGRALNASTKDWPAFFRQAYNALTPGGWLEMSDIQAPFGDFDGTMKGTWIEEWGIKQAKACEKLSIDPQSSRFYKQWMTDQGFEDVIDFTYKWPIGSWPKDKRNKYLGKMVLMNALSGIDGFSLRLWSGVLEMPIEQVLVELAAVKKDMANPKIHAYFPMITCYGRKPLSA